MRTAAVFFGGNSNEHEISIVTGMLAVNLLRTKFRVLPVYLPSGGGMRLAEEAHAVTDFGDSPQRKQKEIVFTQGGIAFAKNPKRTMKIDCALNCCHGGRGEDGTLSALLDWYGIRSASPALSVSAVFMDKGLAKIAARGLGIPVAEGFCVREEDWLRDEKVLNSVEEFGYPVVVKPCRLGSSIGITVAREREEARRAFETAFYLDGMALVERCLPQKRDLNCAAWRKGEAVICSPIEEVFSKGRILTFEEKYERTGAGNSQIPAEIPAETAREIAGYLTKIYRAFAGNGVVRADFLLSEGNVYFNELNTVPGSLACYLFGKSLSESRDFLVRLVEEALRAEAPEKPILKTGILNSQIFAGKGCKRR